MKRILISEKKLSNYTVDRNVAARAKGLLESQKVSWDFLREGYKSLGDVQIKKFDFGEFSIKAQFNPNRITSTTADVSGKSKTPEGSFLYYKNLPEEQLGLR